MRNSFLLLRGKTPPPRRLMPSVSAGADHAVLSSQALYVRAAARDPLTRQVEQHAKTPPRNSVCGTQALFVPAQGRGSIARASASLLLPSSAPAGKIPAEVASAVGLPHHGGASMRSTLRTTSASALNARAPCAATAPLRSSARCVSADSRPGVTPAAHHRDGGEGERDARTSFGAGKAGPTSPTSPAPAAPLSRGSANRTQRRQQQLPPRPTHSTQFLDHGTGSRGHRRRDGGLSTASSSIHTAAAGTRAASDSRAVRCARLMRRHRLHSAQPYLVVSPGSATQFQERHAPRSGLGGVRSSAYSGREHGCGNNVGMPAFPNSAASPFLPATTGASASPQVVARDAAFVRMQEYEPFERLLHRYLERGHVAYATQRLLHHPNAPAPAVLLDRILQHRVPEPALVSQALLSSTHAVRSDRSTSAEAALALQRVATRLQADAVCRPLYDTPGIRVLLLEATLREALYDIAMELVQDTPAEWITPHAWSLLVQAAGQTKLPHSQILWRLLGTKEGSTAAVEQMSSATGGSGSMQRVLTRAGESALLRRVPLCPPHNLMPAVAPPAPSAHCSSIGAASTATACTQPVVNSYKSSTPSHPGLPSAVPATAPSSVLPLDTATVSCTAFDVRTCSTVLAPTCTGIGIPLFQLGTGNPIKRVSAGADERAGDGVGDCTAALPPPSSMSSALLPSAFSTEGMRWCDLGSVDMGYAAEHYNSDTAPAAGDFRSAGAAGVLHGFTSFQSLFSEVEDGIRQSASAGGTSAASSPLSSRESRRAVWETTALRMLHHHRGIVYGLDATTTARVLLRCGVGFSGQASPLLAVGILRRYLRSCHLLRDEIVRVQALIEAQLDAEAGVLTEGGRRSWPTPPSRDAATTAISQHYSAEQLRVLYPRLSSVVTPHPSPFLVFFKVMREAREVLSNAVEEEAAAAVAGAPAAAAGCSAAAGLRANNSLPMVHWELVWNTFQQLNCENRQWYMQMTVQEAGDLCQDVIEVLCHGADPWLTLNVSRRVAARHIVDGVNISLWLLHRLDPSHHTEEAREVARKLFRWLLVDVGLHLQPSLHHHLIPAARALIRLGLQEELRVLYSAVLDNVYLFSAEHRDAFMQVLKDLICSSCSNMLPERDVYVDRVCPNCMTVVPAKDADTIPSFRLSAEHVERLRARRKQQRQRSRQRLTASVHRLQSGEHNGEASAARRQHSNQLRGPQDAAEVLRRHLQRGKEREDGDDDDSSTMGLLLSDAATLVPGVPVASDYTLFPVAGFSGTKGGVPVLDVRAAMEESSRRLELQRAARRYALAQRGEADDGFRDASASSSNSLTLARRTSAAMPTTLPISAQALDAATLKYLSTAANTSAYSSAANAAAAAAARDGVWVCVWCQERNTEWSSRVQCSACGAETGPSAPWRHFVYADPVGGDVMMELRGRMSNCEERPVDAIVAGYMLMVYRRTFQLRATPADHERLQRLVVMLCHLQERVLAGYVYTRLVPLTHRHTGALLDLLAQTYGQQNEARYRALTQEDLTLPEREGAFFEAVFGPQTCRACFGSHDWHLCPIVTRDFAGAADQQRQHQQRSPISLSPEEKQRAVLERLAQRIHQAAKSVGAAATAAVPSTASTSTTTTASAGRPNAQLVVDAYVAFVSSPFREIFAELHAGDANQLSLLLSCIQQYRRAAFVLCHIPQTQRLTEAYLRLISFFNVTEEEALTLLGGRGPQLQQPVQGDVAAPPNFVQVTKTCCMCLDQRHASHECPRLDEWLRGVQRLAKAGEDAAAAAASSTVSRDSTALMDVAGEARLRQRLRAQVDGWTTAGPERLHAFNRYLAAHMELLRPSAAAAAAPPRRMNLNDPLIYAVNKTLTKLATLGRRSETYRLYTHAPVECLSIATTATVLRMNGFAEDSIRALCRADDDDDDAASPVDGGDTATTTTADAKFTMAHRSSERSLSSVQKHAPLAARTAAVPMQRCCLLCFSSQHAYVDCPELAAAATEAEKLLLVAKEVGGISSVHDGIGAAAVYVYSEYNRGRLSSEMMRSNPALVAALLTLVRRCFATRQLSHGVRVLRRLPVEMVPPATVYADLWRAAGLPEEAVEQKQAQLLALFDAEGLVPCVDPPPPRPTYSNSFLSQLSRTLHDDLCRHCYEHGHTIATCPLFHSEVSFGRDYVAAYRMSMMSEQLDRAWQEAYLLKLVDFFQTHHLAMPYHIAGVANTLNAITAMWSFRGEPGIALRNLLLIPPAYRRRQSFKHVLHCLRVPSVDITRLLGDFYFVPDSMSSSSSSRNSSSADGGSAQQRQEMMMAQHLLIPKPAIRDVARRQIFEQVPAAMVALEESTERMACIRANHERRGAAGESSSLGKGARDGSVGISAHIELSLRQEQSPDFDGVAASSFHSPILRRVVQSGDIAHLREDFDPILAELENAVGMRLGSRHTLFTSAMDILSSAEAATGPAAPSGPAGTRRSMRTSFVAQSSAPVSSPSPAGSDAKTAAGSAGGGVPAAEVVIGVQTQSIKPSSPLPPVAPSTPSSSSYPKQRSSAPEQPSSAPPRHLRAPRPRQQQQHKGKGAESVGIAPATAPQATGTPARQARPGSGAAPQTVSHASDDDVHSAFPDSSRSSLHQGGQQRQRMQRATDNNFDRYSRHDSRRHSRSNTGNRSSSQRQHGNSRPPAAQPLQRSGDRRDGRGSTTEKQ
ncbi:hypothetical protein ABL78_4006 [Leptomonas seymouri]|uniref:Uncharacterized protein n=1 Tax=Leptomonas seymouri TaxID=5684 RepID=A0A0N1IL02_LEPSE|nr:hypothetical protein ABL78_4006 [Leptomonas seymouri]|eukprot:KPI86913.1 hypothetical protein ABL78_4006 [Leptomonas seymouri]